MSEPIWIKDPLAILAEGAERGVVVRDGQIVELVAAGRAPQTAGAKVFDAGDHVILPGLINTHHHFYQNSHPRAAGRARPRIVPLVEGALSGMGAADP